MPSAGPGPVCDECSTARNLAPGAVTGTFCRAVALGLYEGRLAAWVRALKHDGRRELARPLGSLLAIVVAGALGARYSARSSPHPPRRPGARGRPGAWNAVVVPVPMHPTRLRQRGYNHAELIAAALARCLGLAMDASALVRTGVARPQASLDRQARLRNLRGVFEPRRPGGRARSPLSGGLQGLDVLLADDVFTTGATLQACSEALLAAGAQRVLGCVVCAGVPRRLWPERGYSC